MPKTRIEELLNAKRPIELLDVAKQLYDEGFSMQMATRQCRIPTSKVEFLFLHFKKD